MRIALLVIGVMAIIGVYRLMRLWPGGFAWHTGPYSDYAIMIVAIYATLGVFLVGASRDPLANLSLIWFTVWSSLVHGGLMAVQSLAQDGHTMHLAGDMPLLLGIGAVLGVLTSRGRRKRAPRQEDLDPSSASNDKHLVQEETCAS